jgi:hypothetical protein
VSICHHAHGVFVVTSVSGDDLDLCAIHDLLTFFKEKYGCLSRTKTFSHLILYAIYNCEKNKKLHTYAILVCESQCKSKDARVNLKIT